MADDVADRLRETAKIIPHDFYSWLNPLLLEAANEIEDLRQQIPAPPPSADL